MYAILKIERAQPANVSRIGYAPTEEQARTIVAASQMAALAESPDSTKFAYGFVLVRDQEAK